MRLRLRASRERRAPISIISLIRTETESNPPPPRLGGKLHSLKEEKKERWQLPLASSSLKILDGLMANSHSSSKDNEEEK